ncbi:PREDICTED: uncharacterized protein LOC107064817 [Polistes dominula]|uniref:Uncharacterized protein LOC107064817 n=1 Tax=Polistes dominula TaxID=743375 RepID=A0ABM1HZI9_POLDO|nr:PREDICTED: uncharacterized protein LOC107064817 [Polistes dominula]
MERFFSQSDCISKPSETFCDDNQFKGCCMPLQKIQSPCTPIITLATKTKCVTLRLIITFILLILIMACIYRISGQNLPRLSYRRRIEENPRLGETSIPNPNPTLNPNSKPHSDETDETQETLTNLEKTEDTNVDK